MRRFYFDVSNGGIYSDEHGACFPSVEEAVKYGSHLAHELAADGSLNGYLLTVTDESGNKVAQFVISTSQ